MLSEWAHFNIPRMNRQGLLILLTQCKNHSLRDAINPFIAPIRPYLAYSYNKKDRCKKQYEIFTASH
jgi:hypothetical protein